MKQPPGYTRLFPYILVEGAAAYLPFLTRGLGGEIVGITTDNGDPSGVRIANARLRFGDTTIMVSDAGKGYGPTHGTFYLYVENAQIAVMRATAAGAEALFGPDDMPFGDFQAGVRDPAGNIWWLSQRLDDGDYEYENEEG